MKLKPALLAALVLTCAACGTDNTAGSDDASTTTSAAAASPTSTGPLDESAIESYRARVAALLAPCTDSVSAPSIDACVLAVPQATDVIEELDERLPESLPKTKAAIRDVVWRLTSWWKYCPDAVVIDGNQAVCATKAPHTSITIDIVSSWYEETGRRN